jgi:hypothetical protein
MPVLDRRTLRELLADCDGLAREALLDMSADRAWGMVRGWPQLIHSAAELWAALPPEPSRSALADPMPILREVGSGVGRSLAAGHWPGHGPRDESWGEIAANFIRAQHLINQHASGPQTQSTLREADLANSHTQVVHALYVVAHATAVALTEYERDLQRLLEAGARRRQPLAERPTTLEVDSARGMIDRFDAIEQLLRTGSTPPTNLKPVKTDQPRASRTHWPPGSSKRTGHSPPTKTRPIWSESPACRHSSPPQPSLSAKLPGDEARSTRA